MFWRRPTCWGGLGFVLVASLTVAAPQVAAQTADQAVIAAAREVIADQNAIIRQYSRPLTKPPSIGITVHAPVAGVPPERLAETRFRLTAVDLEGMTALDPATFAFLWQGLIGKEISLLDLKALLDRIESAYRQRDYLAVAVAPPQDFSSGRVRIVVSEGYIRDLVVKGDISRFGGRLEPFLARVVAIKPLRVSQIYRQLLIMEDLAGVSVDAQMSRIDDEPGAARLVLTISFKPGELNIKLNNYGAEGIGPLQGGVLADVNDMFGMFESTEFLAVANPAAFQRLAYVKLSQSVPMGPTGFSFSYGIGQSWSNPETPAAKLVRLHAEVATANVGLNYALLRADERNVIVTAAVNGNNTSLDVGGQPALREYTRWVSFGAKYNDKIGGVSFIVNPVFLQGVDAFGSNVQHSQFSAAAISGMATTNLTDSLAAKLLFNGQYAFNTLPAAMLVNYGGETFGRGFEPGAIHGNSAVLGALELAQKIDTRLSWLPGFSLCTFVDYGAVWNPPDVATYEYAFLSSIGFGIRTGIGQHLVASGFVVQPLGYNAQLAALGLDQSLKLRFTAGLRF
jgi:hemolysin activation/secretion protein